MAQLTVLRPDVPEDAAPVTARAPRSAPARPAVLTLIENGKPNARALLRLIGAELGARTDLVRVDTVSKPSASRPITADEADGLAAGSDLVITGLGDCAACSACSLQDAVLLERRGVPATVVISDVFQGLAANFAQNLGMPGYAPVVVPHPVSSKDEAALAVMAGRVADTVARDLLGG